MTLTNDDLLRDVGYEPYPCDVCMYRNQARFGLGCTAPEYTKMNFFDQQDHWQKPGKCEFYRGKA